MENISQPHIYLTQLKHGWEVRLAAAWFNKQANQ